MEKKEERKINLVIPLLRPTNGRIMFQLESKERFKQHDSGLILPASLTKEKNKDNRSTENPDDYEYYVVAWAPEVTEQLKFYERSYIPEFVPEPERSQLQTRLGKIAIGEKAVLSENFETIKYSEGKTLYGLVHWQDILGFLDQHQQSVAPGMQKVERPPKLTLKQFDKLKINEPFMMGSAIDSPESVNMSNSGKMLYWVATKGDANDWAIYCSFKEDMEYNLKQGDKIKDMDHVKKLVDCDDKVLARYRK